MDDHQITKKLFDNQSQNSSNPTDDQSAEVPTLPSEAIGQIQNAPFSNRFWSNFEDFCIFSLLGIPTFFVVGLINSYSYTEGTETWFSIAGYGASIRFICVPILQSLKKQSSWGQRAMDIYVCDNHGRRIGFLRALFRYSIRIICLVSIIGVLFILWDRKKRALHDIICGTEVRLRADHSILVKV
jgi:uncharacterized RDD family membrane protein YckC